MSKYCDDVHLQTVYDAPVKGTRHEKAADVGTH
jgi:hypothetical protein